jgi:hypothetical protein
VCGPNLGDATKLFKDMERNEIGRFDFGYFISTRGTTKMFSNFARSHLQRSRDGRNPERR